MLVKVISRMFANSPSVIVHSWPAAGTGLVDVALTKVIEGKLSYEAIVAPRVEETATVSRSRRKLRPEEKRRKPVRNAPD